MTLILYIEKPKDFTRKLLELINEYCKVVGYKINTQKSLAFLYTNNEKVEKEIKETIPFMVTYAGLLGLLSWYLCQLLGHFVPVPASENQGLW